MNGKHTKVEEMTTDELRNELLSNLKTGIEGLQRRAELYTELTKRGEEFPQINKQLGDYLKKIAAGLITAKTFFHHGARPILIDRMEYLTPQLQDKLTDGKKKISVVVYDNGKYSTVNKTIGDMETHEIVQTIRKNGLVSVEKQEEELRKKNEKVQSEITKNLFLCPSKDVLKYSHEIVTLSDGSRITGTDLIRVLTDRYKCDVGKFIEQNAEEM